ncbi:hypothetical protein HAX54_027570 [Datura stramonium]|uniref:Uncharacterized protein n=1 Tax=Datura stramonium TaxID=4076 RepID=A0ABS8S8Y5_DATST|nr:hypothetical protein [Datura stramonium]
MEEEDKKKEDKIFEEQVQLNSYSFDELPTKEENLEMIHLRSNEGEGLMSSTRLDALVQKEVLLDRWNQCTTPPWMKFRRRSTVRPSVKRKTEILMLGDEAVKTMTLDTALLPF